MSVRRVETGAGLRYEVTCWGGDGTQRRRRFKTREDAVEYEDWMAIERRDARAEREQKKRAAKSKEKKTVRAIKVKRGKLAEAKRLAQAKARERKYGLEPERFEWMWEEQGGVCLWPTCLVLLDDSCHVDHCHESGRVRGLVCGRHNTAEGYGRVFIQEGGLEYLGADDPLVAECFGHTLRVFTVAAIAPVLTKIRRGAGRGAAAGSALPAAASAVPLSARHRWFAAECDAAASRGEG